MDIKVWEKTIVAWLNSLSNSPPVDSINQISDSYLKDIIRKINKNYENSPVEFLKEAFPNLTDSDSFELSLNTDYLCASTLLLMFVSLSKKEGLKEIRDLMCTKLDTSVQLNIVEFLNNIQEHSNIFNFSFKKITQEIFPALFINFKEKHCVPGSVIGDGSKTPVKSEPANCSFDSPLQGFFKTPKRNINIHTKSSYKMCGDGDHLKRIKKLTDQLIEEESEKTTLQEQLNIQTQKCYELEMKLKSKLEEMDHLKEEWENESKKNEEDVHSLENNVKQKIENEKKLKNEISHLENYISNLESDLGSIMVKNEKLEKQLKSAMEKFEKNEKKLKESTELCLKFQSAINEKEKELEQFKENYVNFYNDEKAIDASFMNGSFDKSICSPESLEVVVDKLLREKIEENTSLQETINGLQQDKNSLLSEVKSLNEQLMSKCSIISEIEFLNKELSSKMENFDKTEKELLKTHNELLSANSEIIKLIKENSHLTEKYNIINNRLQEREQSLINSNNLKMLLHVNFLKIAEDFKGVQHRLEYEVKNISRFVLSKCEKLPKTEEDLKLLEDNEGKDSKDCMNKKGCLRYSQEELNDLEIPNEIIPSLNSSVLMDDNFCKSSEFFHNIDSHTEWLESKVSLQKTYNQLNDSIILLKDKLIELEEHYRNCIETKSKTEKHLKEAEEKLIKTQTTSAEEIMRLKEELEEKKNTIKDLEKCLLQSKKMQEALILEKETFIQEAKILSRNFKTIHEGGDHKGVQTVSEGGDHKGVQTVSEGGDHEFIQTVSEVGDLKNIQTVHEGGNPKSIQTVIKGTDCAPYEIEGKLEVPCERQEFSDSLEEVSVVNKTFDIVNLEERNLSDRTFSIKKEVTETSSENLKTRTTWVVSPPSKVLMKKSKETVRLMGSKRALNEKLVIPLDSVKAKENRVKKVSSSISDLRLKNEDPKIVELQAEITELKKKCERFKYDLLNSKQELKKEKEIFEKNQEILRQTITAKYESQLEHLKNEMKQLYNRELAKHKQEQSTLNSELREQNKRYKEHIDELRNQLWDLGEKLLQEQTIKRDLERTMNELKEKYECLIFSKEPDLSQHVNEGSRQKEPSIDENVRMSFRHVPSATFPTIPIEDEDEVFDNRFLEDMKTGICKMERPEERLKELQYRNSLCLPHLKSSYPGETQFHNPSLFKDSDLKYGLLPFAQESQSLTDSDHSMTKSLLPDNKGKKKEQTSYKRPGPPTPSKNGGRPSIQSGDLRLTPRSVLKELNDQNERNKGTPNPLKLFLMSRSIKRGSIGSKDENTAPVTPRKKKFFRKPFGARDH